MRVKHKIFNVVAETLEVDVSSYHYSLKFTQWSITEGQIKLKILFRLESARDTHESHPQVENKVPGDDKQVMSAEERQAGEQERDCGGFM